MSGKLRTSFLFWVTLNLTNVSLLDCVKGEEWPVTDHRKDPICQASSNYMECFLKWVGVNTYCELGEERMGDLVAVHFCLRTLINCKL